MIKVFIANENGKIEFTKEELEKLLNDAFNDGYREGCGFKKRTTSTSLTTPDSDPYTLVYKKDRGDALFDYRLSSSSEIDFNKLVSKGEE